MGRRGTRHLHLLHRPCRQPDRATSCTNNGPRGAANDASLARQQDKIVNAINRLDADIVSLEEIENSVALGETNRDDAPERPRRRPSTRRPVPPAGRSSRPCGSGPPAAREQDVIRNAFIYKPANVALVGASKVLRRRPPSFSNAREPLAQAFKPVGAPDTEAFARHRQPLQVQGPSGNRVRTRRRPVQGCSTVTACARPQSLVTFADEFADRRVASTRCSSPVTSTPTPRRTRSRSLDAAGYTSLESDTEPARGATASTASPVRSTTCWPTRRHWPESTGSTSGRSTPTSRSTTSTAASTTTQRPLRRDEPFAASDHNPEIVGINRRPAPPRRPTSRSSASTTTTAAWPRARVSGVRQGCSRGEPEHRVRGRR